ncbi:MAG: HAD family hydrolase [Arachnia sp.]
MVALDIDGTLCDNFGRLPSDVRAAVRRVRDAGVPVVLSTGRTWMATRPVFEELGLPPGWAVTSNGAMVVTFPPLTIVYEDQFDPADTIQRVVGTAPEAIIAVQEGLKLRANRPFPDGELSEAPDIEPIEELASRPVSRIIIRDPNASEVSFQQMTEQLGLHEVSYSIGWSAWLDIAPKGIDKAAGLQRVVDSLGLSAADVLAIGDGRNDIEMLTWAGRGVAMGNSAAEVKASADDVTEAFLQGGVANELARWF